MVQGVLVRSRLPSRQDLQMRYFLHNHGPAAVGWISRFLQFVRNPPAVAPSRFVALFAGVFAGLLFAARLCGPSTLMDKDQERPAAYVLDILKNGHWLCPRDWTGDFASKPPVSVWLSAALSKVVGGVALWTLWFPGAIGIGATGMILAVWGWRAWGWREGLLSSVCFLACPLSAKLVGLNRTDGFFVLTVALTAAFAVRAWERGCGWHWFWMAAALSTLTKGPLGLLLGGVGLLAEFWERRDGRPLGPAKFSGFLWPGAGAYLAVSGGWLAAAVTVEGAGVAAKMLGSELAGHAINPAYGPFGRGLVLAPCYFIARFIPWSLLAVVFMGRVVRRPEADDANRRLERFLALWLVAGLGVLALATHQRGDLVAPMLPPAALLAGREMGGWTRRWDGRSVWAAASAVAAASLVITVLIYHIGWSSETVQRSEGMAELALRVRGRLNPGEEILFVDAPFALQADLGQFCKPATYESAAASLLGGRQRLVAVRDLARLQRLLPADIAAEIRPVARWPPAGKPWVQVVGRDRIPTPAAVAKPFPSDGI